MPSAPLHRALQSRSYTVLTAETGERALAVVEEIAMRSISCSPTW